MTTPLVNHCLACREIFTTDSLLQAEVTHEVHKLGENAGAQLLNERLAARHEEEHE